MKRLEAIVLAGGSGSRFGGGKLLAPYQGGVLVEAVVRTAMAAPVSRVIIVTGHDGDRVGAAAKALASRTHPHPSLSVIHADRHREGMAETLKTGLAALSNDVDGAFVFLGDMPRVPASVAAKLVDGIGECAAATPVFGGRRGHPALLSARFFPHLMTLTGDQGARNVLDQLGSDLALIPVDDAGVLFDVDRPADLVA